MATLYEVITAPSFIARVDGYNAVPESRDMAFARAAVTALEDEHANQTIGKTGVFTFETFRDALEDDDDAIAIMAAMEASEDATVRVFYGLVATWKTDILLGDSAISVFLSALQSDGVISAQQRTKLLGYVSRKKTNWEALGLTKKPNPADVANALVDAGDW